MIETALEGPRRDEVPPNEGRCPATDRFKFICTSFTTVGVSFDLFGTLVAVERPADPARAVARELRQRDVAVPADWSAVYREDHVDAPAGAEVPLPAHVGSALAARGIETTNNAVRRAVVAAFDPEVRTRAGAADTLGLAADHGPVAVCSNCAVPELVRRTLIRADLPRDRIDAVITSVGCGWRKPHRRIFAVVADRLAVPGDRLVHVGDDPRTDAGVTTLGGTALLVDSATASPPDAHVPTPPDDANNGDVVQVASLTDAGEYLEGSRWV